MKMMLTVGTFLLLTAPLAMPQARGSVQAPSEEEIRAQLRAWDQAYQARDVQTLGRILADEFTLTDASGAVLTKAEYLMSVVKSPGFNQPASFASQDVTVQIDGDKAVVTGRSAVKGRGRGKAQACAGNYRLTDQWVRQQGTWKAKETRATRIGPEKVPRRDTSASRIISRCSASADRRFCAARILSARMSSSSTFRTIRCPTRCLRRHDQFMTPYTARSDAVADPREKHGRTREKRTTD